MTLPDLLKSLPSSPNGDDFKHVCAAVAAGAPKLVVLDDDPTGTQTVHGVPVLADWSVAALSDALRGHESCFYVLTNTRALALADAVTRNREVIKNLRLASIETGSSFTIASRSDSTLRGHFPGEVDTIIDALGGEVDGIVLVPAFFEGGRYTVHGVHYVAEGDRLTPAGETEFARDTTFGFRNSALPDWVEEKTDGRVSASAVARIAIETLRGADGATRVYEQLMSLRCRGVVAVDALAYADLEVFVHGLLRAEEAGRRFVARTAAGFVRVRAGIGPRPILEGAEISPPSSAGGLVVVGSYVAKSTAQLEAARQAPRVDAEEVIVDVLADPTSREREIARVARRADEIIGAGRHALLFTSRRLVGAVGRAGDLDAARTVSSALVAIVRAITRRPRFFIAKGGITSSDLATRGLDMKRAMVLGQAAPGVPVWQMGPETRFPGMAYVVFPGNVGAPETLRDLITRFGVGIHAEALRYERRARSPELPCKPLN